MRLPAQVGLVVPRGQLLDLAIDAFDLLLGLAHAGVGLRPAVGSERAVASAFRSREALCVPLAIAAQHEHAISQVLVELLHRRLEAPLVGVGDSGLVEEHLFVNDFVEVFGRHFESDIERGDVDARLADEVERRLGGLQQLPHPRKRR